MPYCTAGVEFFPAHETADFKHTGYPVRVPLGVHRKSGRRYPFVEYREERFVSVVSTVTQTLQWLASVQRVPVEIIARLVAVNQHAEARVYSRFVKKVRPQMVVSGGDGRWGTIAEWCVEQDSFVVIGRYVDLDSNGIGCCPFGWHHSDGQDSHPSLVVYAPSASSIMCWYCHAWKQGGSVFDFLRYFHGLTAGDL